MTSLVVQIAILDAAGASLVAVSSQVRADGVDLAAAQRGLAVAAPGSALQTDLPGLPLEHLCDVLGGALLATAGRVGDGAAGYRALEAGLVDAFVPAEGVAPVPR